MDRKLLYSQKKFSYVALIKFTRIAKKQKIICAYCANKIYVYYAKKKKKKKKKKKNLLIHIPKIYTNCQ